MSDPPAPSVVGVLAPYTGGYYYGSILAGIHRAARARGARVVAVQTTGLELSLTHSDASLGLEGIDGWIAVNDVNASYFLANVTKLGKPLVYLSRRPAGVQCCTVLPDNHGGTLSAVRHLIDHDHKRIAFVGCLGQLDLRERYEGYLAAHKEAGLFPDPRLLYSCSDNTEAAGSEAAGRLLADGIPCTAVAAGTDKLAFGLIASLRAAGIALPEELAIVGFDDVENAQYVNPPLSTVRQRFDILASKATDTLLDKLQNGKTLPATVRVATALVTRKSCGCTGNAQSIAVPADCQIGQEEALTRALLELAGSANLRTLAKNDWQGAAALSAFVHALATGARPSTKIVGGVWAGFVAVNRDIESIDRAICLIEETANAWAQASVLEPELKAEVKSGLRQLRIELMREWRVSQHDRNRYYDFVAEANGKINQALTGNEFAEAKDLSWLKWTRFAYGCVGLWSGPPSPQRRLNIVSEYGAKDNTLLHDSFSPGAFPPRAASELASALDAENILMLVPIAGSSKTHGLLTVAGPVEVEFLDHVGSLGDWAALVGASLEREGVERELRETAFRDALTGLPNRALLMDRLDQLAGEGRTPTQRFAVLFLDLDNFKNVNDSLGHIAGDELLVEIAARLRNALRDTDLVARLGGDEFAVLVPSITKDEDALDVVARIQDALLAPFNLDGNIIFTSCSVGVTFSTEAQVSATELLRDADTAMYRAKLEGRARHEIFHRGMHTQAMERLRLDTRLRHALENGEFALHYQPIVSLRTGKAVGAEALIRWNHPQQGFLAPGRFLAVADEVGLSVPISRWVLETACAEAKEWQQPHNTPYVNVNLPAQHLKDPNFIALIEELLVRYDLPARALGLELVESSLVESLEATVSLLNELRELGVRTAIDDFGTGYSSLSYLKRFAIQTLKIDRAFIDGIPVDKHDAAIVKAVIAMAHGLGLNVVAEGVERADQLPFLRDQGCDLVQGFLLSRPLPAGECRQHLRTSQTYPGWEEMREGMPAPSPSGPSEQLGERIFLMRPALAKPQC